MIKKSLPLALCLGFATASGAFASDSTNLISENNALKSQAAVLKKAIVKVDERGTVRLGQLRAAQQDLSAIKAHPAYAVILKDQVEAQVREDTDAIQGVESLNLTDLPRDVLFMIFSRSQNLHGLRSSCTTLKNRVDSIKSLYDLPCLHDAVGDRDGDAPHAFMFNFVDSPALRFAFETNRNNYSQQMRVAFEELRLARENQARLIQQEKERVFQAERARLAREKLVEMEEAYLREQEERIEQFYREQELREQMLREEMRARPNLRFA